MNSAGTETAAADV